MTKTSETPKLTDRQFATAAVVMSLAIGSETGEVSEYAARTHGAHTGALDALVRKGVLTIRRGDFVMPVGPLAGQTLTDQPYYSVVA